MKAISHHCIFPQCVGPNTGLLNFNVFKVWLVSLPDGCGASSTETIVPWWQTRFISHSHNCSNKLKYNLLSGKSSVRSRWRLSKRLKISQTSLSLSIIWLIDNKESHYITQQILSAAMTMLEVNTENTRYQTLLIRNIQLKKTFIFSILLTGPFLSKYFCYPLMLYSVNETLIAPIHKEVLKVRNLSTFSEASWLVNKVNGGWCGSSNGPTSFT